MKMYTVINDKCPKCGGTIIDRNGINGQFYGCSKFPECRFTADWKGNHNFSRTAWESEQKEREEMDRMHAVKMEAVDSNRNW